DRTRPRSASQAINSCSVVVPTSTFLDEVIDAATVLDTRIRSELVEIAENDAPPSATDKRVERLTRVTITPRKAGRRSTKVLLVFGRQGHHVLNDQIVRRHVPRFAQNRFG